MDLVWIMKAWGRIWTLLCLKWESFLFKQRIPFYMKSFVEFQTTKKMTQVGLIWLKQGRFQNIARLNLTLTLHHVSPRTSVCHETQF